MVPLLKPILYIWAVPFNNVKVRIQKQYNLVLHLLFVKRNRLRLQVVNVVGKKNWLDHRCAVCDILSVEDVCPIEWLVQTAAKSIDKITSSEVIDVLREISHSFWQRKRGHIILYILSKIWSPFAETCVKPLPDIFLFLHKCFMNAISCEVNNCSFIIKSLCNFMNQRTPLALDCGYTRDNASFLISIHCF